MQNTGNQSGNTPGQERQQHGQPNVHPCNGTHHQHAPPVPKLPSTVKSARSRTLKVKYTPTAMIPQMIPWHKHRAKKLKIRSLHNLLQFKVLNSQSVILSYQIRRKKSSRGRQYKGRQSLHHRTTRLINRTKNRAAFLLPGVVAIFNFRSPCSRLPPSRPVPYSGRRHIPWSTCFPAQTQCPWLPGLCR
mgnify:CR=1 FL=1